MVVELWYEELDYFFTSLSTFLSVQRGFHTLKASMSSFSVCSLHLLDVEETADLDLVSPVSVFDQRLEEDSRVNRLEDSILLWTSICSSKLLARTQLILFLNKCDLLRRKLKRGVKVAQYLPSYGDRPNDVMTVVKCEFSSESPMSSN